MKIAVLGGGKIGSVIVDMLRKDHEVDLVDPAIDYDCIVSPTRGYENWFSVTKASFCDLIVNALPGKIGFDALTMAVEAGKNVVDVSFWDYDQDKVNELDKLAKEKGVTVLYDLGWSPGMTNILIGNAMAEINGTRLETKTIKAKRLYDPLFDSVESVEYYVGGLPQSGPYKSPYCVEDSMKFALVDHWWGDTRLRKKESKDYGLCLFEQRSLPRLCIPYTYRPPEFVDSIKSMEELGMFKPENLPHTTEILRNEWATDENYRDISYMDIYVRGKDRTIEYHMVDKYDKELKMTSMAKLTATTAVLGVYMMVNQRFIKGAGLLTPEFLGSHFYFNTFWQGWKDAGIIIERTET